MEDNDESISGEDDQSKSPIERIGRHAIGLWKATEELGDARLLDALRPFVAAVGFALARDLMSEKTGGDTSH